MGSPIHFRRPRFPEFEVSEYIQRVTRAQQMMADSGLDAMLLTTSNPLRYFAGGPLTGLFEDAFNAFFMLLPADPGTDTALIMSCGREGACQTSWVPDQRFWGYDTDASLMSQQKSLDFVAETVREKGLANAKIGTELDAGLRIGMTQREFRKLRNLLPGVRWESCSSMVRQVAELKSEAELEKIRRAAEITNHAFRRAFESAHVGMTEKELASLIYQSYFEQGATGTGFLAVIAGRERGIWADALPSDYVMREGDLLMIDGGCQVDGYIADISRMASFGKPSDTDRRLYEVAREANASGVAAVKPGVEMRKLFAAGQKPFIDAGFGDLLVFGRGQLGHGIGLSLHEDPDISSGSTKTLQPGMTIAIEPAISDKPEWAESEQFYIVENNVIITEDGCEMLTTLSDELQIME